MMLFFSLFLKFFNYVRQQSSSELMDAHDSNDSDGGVKHISKFAQYYEIVPKTQSPDDPVGRPLVHKSALQQTTGSSSVNLAPRYWFTADERNQTTHSRLIIL